MRRLIQRLKDQQTERELRESQVKELQYCLKENDFTEIDKGLFRRVIEQVRVRSMVEVEFCI